MDLREKKAFIFDLDGTLIDTEKIYRICWPRAVKDMGYTMTDDQYLSLRSLGRPFALKRLQEMFGTSFDYELAKKIRTDYFNEFINADGIEKKPGAIELLTFLREKNVMVAIATATSMDRAEKYIKMAGLDGYFDKVISAAMVDEGKPSPKVYQYACKQLGLKPEECVAIEDAPNGVRSAAAAGLSVIMVPDLTGPDEELVQLIDMEISSLDKIIELF